MNRLKFTLIITCSIFWACNEKTEDSITPQLPPSPNVEVVVNDDFLKINVGDRITNAPLVSQIWKGDNDELFYILLDENRLHFFSLNKNRLTESLQISPWYGKDLGNYNNYSGFNFVNKDTILLYNYAKTEVSIISKNRENVLKIEIKKLFSKETRLDPEALNSSLIRLYDNQVILTGTVFGPIKTGVELASASISIKNNKTTEITTYPSCYLKGNFGGLYFNSVSHTQAPHTMVYSFPADHNIRCYNMENNSMDEYIAASKHISIINSYKGSVFDLLKDKGKRVYYYVTQYSYAQIMYDTYKGYIYRFVEHPIKNYSRDQIGFRKPFSIIVMDSNYNILGETEVLVGSDNLDRTNMHIVPEGIIIRNTLEIDDNLINFSLITFKEPLKK